MIQSVSEYVLATSDVAGFELEVVHVVVTLLRKMQSRVVFVFICLWLDFDWGAFIRAWDAIVPNAISA